MSISRTKVDKRHIWTEDANATASKNETINSTEELVINAHAEDVLRGSGTIFWHDPNSIAIAKGAYNTTINQSGANTAIKND